MEASDREDAVADWLDDHGIDGGWDLAPVFVQAGLDAELARPGRGRAWTPTPWTARCAG